MNVFPTYTTANKVLNVTLVLNNILSDLLTISCVNSRNYIGSDQRPSFPFQNGVKVHGPISPVSTLALFSLGQLRNSHSEQVNEAVIFYLTYYTNRYEKNVFYYTKMFTL